MKIYSNWALGSIFLLMASVVPAVFAVDGVIEINQARALAGGVTAGDAPGFPISITEPGSYRLTGDIAASDSTGIEITAEDVTLDLNGFHIYGVGATPSDGVSVADPGKFNVEIRNGTVRAFPRHGIFSIASVREVRVINVRVIGNLGSGIELEGEHNLVRGCSVRENANRGIRVGEGSLVINNTVRFNGAEGLSAGSSAGFGSNVFTENNDGSANPQTLGGIQIGTNVCGSDTICP